MIKADILNYGSRQMARDPANVVKFECETCNGCKWSRFSLHTAIQWCGLKTKEGKSRKWGMRCNEYKKLGLGGNDE